MFEGCRVVGVSDHDLFVTVDFFERREFDKVASNCKDEFK